MARKGSADPTDFVHRRKLWAQNNKNRIYKHYKYLFSKYCFVMLPLVRRQVSRIGRLRAHAAKQAAGLHIEETDTDMGHTQPRNITIIELAAFIFAGSDAP